MKSTVKRDDPAWLVMPDQVETQLHTWAGRYADRFRLIREVSPSGDFVYMADVGRADAGTDVLIIQPHGHEPAGTAAIMELLAELITGARLNGQATDLPREALERHCRLAINPLGNPNGRSRMPALAWSNEFGWEESIYYSNSKERGGSYLRGDRKLMLRVGEIDLDPEYPLACRWEYCGDDLYVDPWGWPGDLASNPTTIARMARKVAMKRPLALVLDVHQVESDAPEVWVPTFENPTVAERTAALAQKIEAAWQGAGFLIGARHPYEMRGFVRGLHEDGKGRPPLVTVEIGMGVGQADSQMTPDRQKEAGLVALHTALAAVLSGDLAGNPTEA